ncbi:unnamed protein product, partial [Prorocentrum cordatum]
EPEPGGRPGRRRLRGDDREDEGPAARAPDGDPERRGFAEAGASRDLQMTQEAHDRMQRQVEFEERLLGKMDPNQGLGRAIQDLDGFMAEVHRDYNKCRDNHKKCIGILQKEFGYNPLFKAGKPGGPQFHGNPHVMAKDPRKNA